MRSKAGTPVLLQDTGNPDLQRKLQAARDAIRDQKYKAAVQLCKEAEALDPMSLAPLLMKAEANLRQGSIGTCVAIFRRIAERCHELTPGVRQAPAQHLPSYDQAYVTILIRRQSRAIS